MNAYIALLRKDPTSDFGVEFPDFPAASLPLAVMAQPNHHDTVAVLIAAPTRAAKAVRVNVMLPQDMVDAIDRTTKNRSRFLVEAVRAKLHEPP